MTLALIFTIITIVVLTFSVIYLTHSYRKLLEKYSDLSLKIDRNEVRKKINKDTKEFVDEKVNEAISKAVTVGVEEITKNAESVAKSIRQKTVEKLVEEEKGEEKAIAKDYDDVRREIEQFRNDEFEKVRKNTSEILNNVAPEVLRGLMDKDKQEKLIMSELENAKRTNFF